MFAQRWHRFRYGPHVSASGAEDSRLQVVQLGVADPATLFHRLDASPAGERTLARDVEEWLFEQVRDLDPEQGLRMVVLVEGERTDEDDALLASSLRAAFARQLARQTRALHQQRKTAWTGLGVGLGTFAALLLLKTWLGTLESFPGQLLERFIEVGAWVVLWRPFDVMLFEQAPLRRSTRAWSRLCAAAVEVTPAP